MDSTDRKLAGELLRIKAVLLRPDEPFTWASKELGQGPAA